MASPHVSGVAALYKSVHGDASSATVNNWLTSNSTTSVITGNISGTPNRQLFTPSTAVGPTLHGRLGRPASAATAERDGATTEPRHRPPPGGGVRARMPPSNL